MISFHEGLPGAGKSYEACVRHIIPALQAGRRVVTNIEGVSHKKFAAESGLPVAMVEAFLVCVDIPLDDVEELPALPSPQNGKGGPVSSVERRIELIKEAFLEHIQNDCLVVWDEINQYFPPGRQKMDDVWTLFVTEHRHRGLDIILMGQHHKDMHTIWRRRIERRVVFTKLTVVGEPDKYRWEMYTCSSLDKYTKVSSGSNSYESRFFGLYESITKDTKNVDVYADSRAVAFTKKHIYAGIAAGFTTLAVALYILVGFFTPQDLEHNKTPVDLQTPGGGSQNAKKPQQYQAVGKPQNIKAQQIAKEAPPVRPWYLKQDAEYDPIEKPLAYDYLVERIEKYRLRLAGTISNISVGPGYTFGKSAFLIEVLDNSNHVKETFTKAELNAMGWTAELKEYGLDISKDAYKVIVRPFPLENPYAINNRTRESL